MEPIPVGTEKTLSEYLFRTLSKLESSINRLVNQTLTTSKNYIINGDFNIWQRGASFTSGYTADMWAMALVGDSCTVTKDTLTYDPVIAGSKYGLKCSVTPVANAANYFIIAHKIENIVQLAGKTVTLSFKAKGTGSILAVEFIQNFGTGGSNTVAGIGITKVQYSSTWKKYVVTLDIPDITGKTMGTENTDYTGINFWLDAGANFNSRTNSLGQRGSAFNITLSRVKLNDGSKEININLESVETELPKCQRHYEKSFQYGVTPAQNTGSYLGSAMAQMVVAGAVANRFPTIPFKVTKRVAPTITLYSPQAASGEVYDGTSAVTCTSSAVQQMSDTGFSINATGNASSAVNNRAFVHWTADASL